MRLRKLRRGYDCEGCRRCGCSVCVMKIVSWNAKGLSGFEKRMEMRSLVSEKKSVIVYV